MNLKTILSQYLRETADKLDEDSCNMSREEQEQLFSLIAHQELNKTEAAELLGMSTRTFDRKISEGELPAGQHIRGSKSLVWYRDEIELSKTKEL